MSSNTSLEELVVALERYGKPFMMLHDDGCWSCTAKLRTNIKEASFEVKSANNTHKQLRGAVQECLSKAIQAVASFEFVPKNK